MAHNKTTKTKRHLKKDSLVSKSDKARYDQVDWNVCITFNIIKNINIFINMFKALT